MSFTLRFLATDPRELEFSALSRALMAADGRFRLLANPRAMRTEAELRYGQASLASLSLRPAAASRELFDEVVAQIREESPGHEGEHVIRRIVGCRWVLLVELLGSGIHAEATLERLDPLVSWVMSERMGMLWVEGEGFYDASGPLLPLGW